MKIAASNVVGIALRSRSALECAIRAQIKASTETTPRRSLLIGERSCLHVALTAAEISGGTKQWLRSAVATAAIP